MEELSIEHRTSPIYHQQSNPVERRVQELKKIMRTRADPRKTNKWDRSLADALFCLRTRTNAATNTSPSELLLGYQLRRPGEHPRDGEAVDQLERQAADSRRARIERVRHRQAYYKRKIFPDERGAMVQFTAGEEVLAREPVVPGHPFHPVWSGPWRVTSVRGDNTYEIEKAGKIVLIHVNDLRAVVPDRANPGRVQPRPDKDEPKDPSTPAPEPSRATTDVQPELVNLEVIPDPKAASYRLPGTISALVTPEGSMPRPHHGTSDDVILEPAGSRNVIRTDSGCVPAPWLAVPATQPQAILLTPRAPSTVPAMMLL